MGLALNVAQKRGSLSGKENAEGQLVEITEEWIVRTAFGAEASTAMAATGLPAHNSQHPTLTDLRVASREPTRQDNGFVWIVNVVYKPVSLISTSDNYRLIHIEYGTHELQQDVTHNLGTGEVLVDANGKPFAQTIQVPRSYPYIKIVKKQQTVSRSDVLTKSGTINDADVTVAGVSIPKWCGKIKIYATEQENETYDWEISYEVLVRYFTLSNYLDFAGVLQAGPTQVGWMEGIINQGFYKYVAGETELQRITEVVEKSDGTTEERPSATPVPLDENGAQLAEGATPISVLLQTIPSSDWSGLGLNSL